MKTFKELVENNLNRELSESSHTWERNVDDHANDLFDKHGDKPWSGVEVDSPEYPLYHRSFKAGVKTQIHSSHKPFDVGDDLHFKDNASKKHKEIKLPKNSTMIAVEKPGMTHFYGYHPEHGHIHIAQKRAKKYTFKGET